MRECGWSPIQAMLRRKTNDAWTDKRRNATRRTEKYFTVSDEQKCRGCNKEEGTPKHRLYHCPSWREVRNQIPECLGEMGVTGQSIED